MLIDARQSTGFAPAFWSTPPTVSRLTPTILDRYLVRECALAGGAVLAVLFSVLFANRLIRYLADAAGGELAGSAVAVLMGLQVLRYLGVILPAALFLGAILAIGRLYRDSEMPVLAACGVGPARVMRGLLLLGLPAAVLVAWLSFSVGPWATHAADERAAEAADSAQLQELEAGRFVGTGDATLYAGRNLGDGVLAQVFVRSHEAGRETVVHASRAHQRVDTDTGERYLILEDGWRYDGVPGKTDWRMTSFERHGVLLERRSPSEVARTLDGEPPSALWGRADADARAELHWRMAMPLMLVILLMLAVPASRASPRDGRFGRLMTAILVYVAYFQLLTYGREWIEDGVVPGWLGLWWIHAGALAIAVLWTRHAFGSAWGVKRRPPSAESAP